MRESERTVALLGALAIVVVTLLMGLERPVPLPGVDAGRPLVGRTATEVSEGVPDAFRGIRRTTDADREAARVVAVMARFDRELARDPWSGRFTRIVIHPLEGALPTVSGEEGAPWHYVIDADGRVAPTERLLKGRAGAAPGLPVEAALGAIHVMIPEAGTMPPARSRGVADLIRWLRRRLGRKTDVLLAPEIEGATVSLPDGVDRETLLPEDGR